MQFRFALAVALIPTISGFAFADDSFTVDEFRRIHTEIVPPTELWKSIPWQTDLIQAQQQAAEQHKLIFIWAMDGHPLGCTWNNGVVDRALTFSDPEIVRMLKNHFVPVAIDQWHQRTQQDVEGDFYRKIAGQGPRKDFDHTTQGRYVCTPSGTLLAYNNNRGPEKIRAMMHKALEEFDPEAEGNVAPLSSRESAHVRDARHDVRPPESGFILRVHSKVLGGYGPVADREAWMLVFQSAVGRDNAWFTAEEQSKLAAIIRTGGEIPPPLSLRLARFHLIDNTRGEPPRWRTDEIKSLQMSIDGDGRISGTAYLETSNAKRGYECRLLGEAEANGNQVTRFDLVAKGEFWGGGRYTQHAPDGRFPLAVAFRIADGSDPADQIPPHGTKGWVEGYYE